MKMREMFPHWADIGLWIMFISSVFLVFIGALFVARFLDFDNDILLTSIIGGLVSGFVLILFNSTMLQGLGVKEVKDQVTLQRIIRREIDSHETKMRIKEAIRTVLDERNINEK